MKNIFEGALSDYGTRRFVAWQPELEGIHVPVWYSAPTSLPGAAFCLEVPLKASHASEAWPALEKCLRTALCIDGWASEEDLVQVLSAQLQRGTDEFDNRFHRACRTIQQAMCLAANSCDYTPDVGLDPEQHDVERFVDACKTRAVDCEDSAKLCFLMAWLLLLAGTPLSLGAGHVLLYWSGMAMRCFVPAMFTTSASAPSAGGSSSQFTSEAPEPINHIAAQLVPRFLFCQWIANSGLAPYDKLKRACETATGQPERAWERKQTQVWVMEGTTYCDGGFLPYHHYFAESEREQVKQRVIKRERTRMLLEQRWPVLRRMSLQVREAQHPRACAYNLLTEDVRSMPLQEFSPFYRYPSHLWSPALLMWRARADAELPLVIDFHVRYTSQGAASYGVKLQDIVARCGQEIALQPVYVLGDGDYDLLLNRVAQQEPVLVSAPDLLLPQGQPSCTPARAPSVEEISRQHSGLTTLLRLAAQHPKGATGPPDPWSYICYRINHAAKLAPELLEALEQMLVHHTDIGLEAHVHDLGVGELYIVEIKLCVRDIASLLDRLLLENGPLVPPASGHKPASGRAMFLWDE